LEVFILKIMPADAEHTRIFYIIIKGTHYGRNDEHTPATSKKVFNILKSKFKNTSWAKQTKYYY